MHPYSKDCHCNDCTARRPHRENKLVISPMDSYEEEAKSKSSKDWAWKAKDAVNDKIDNRYPNMAQAFILIAFYDLLVKFLKYKYPDFRP